MQPEIVTFLMWSSGGLLAVLTSLLAWLALGVIARLEKLKLDADRQYMAFGKQLAALHDLVASDIHRLDLRITKLEEWRKGIDHHV